MSVESSKGSLFIDGREILARLRDVKVVAGLAFVLVVNLLDVDGYNHPPSCRPTSGKQRGTYHNVSLNVNFFTLRT